MIPLMYTAKEPSRKNLQLSTSKKQNSNTSKHLSFPTSYAPPPQSDTSPSYSIALQIYQAICLKSKTDSHNNHVSHPGARLIAHYYSSTPATGVIGNIQCMLRKHHESQHRSLFFDLLASLASVDPAPAFHVHHKYTYGVRTYKHNEASPTTYIDIHFPRYRGIRCGSDEFEIYVRTRVDRSWEMGVDSVFALAHVGEGNDALGMVLAALAKI